jgi:hypothetical protein
MFKKALEYAGVYRKTTYAAIAVSPSVPLVRYMRRLLTSRTLDKFGACHPCIRPLPILR